MVSTSVRNKWDLQVRSIPCLHAMTMIMACVVTLLLPFALPNMDQILELAVVSIEVIFCLVGHLFHWLQKISRLSSFSSNLLRYLRVLNNTSNLMFFMLSFTRPLEIVLSFVILCCYFRHLWYLSLVDHNFGKGVMGFSTHRDGLIS